MSSRPPRERWDSAFKALAAAPRRELVVRLQECAAGESVSLPDAAIRPDAPVDRERLALALHHQHLPRLANSGYVRWTDEPFRARRGPRFAEIATVLEAIADAADRFPAAMDADYHRLEGTTEHD
jgi:hypothetical protein